MSDSEIIKSIRYWLNDIVIGLQFCPFAHHPYRLNRIHYQVSRLPSAEARINELLEECQRLDQDQSIETTLIIYPNALESYFDYQQFLEWANSTLKNYHWQGVYQLASFHPNYCFAYTDEDDKENYTNRSPYPIIHLLREDSLTTLIDKHPDIDRIPEINKNTIASLSEEEFRRLFSYLFSSN